MSSNENDNPQAPSAPLGGSPDNPYASSSPSADLSGDSNRNFAYGPGKYYGNPPILPGNPNAQGAQGQADNLNQYMNGNLDACYAGVMGAQPADEQAGGLGEATIADIYLDEAFGKTGTGNS
jgi:hypothetical protein